MAQEIRSEKLLEYSLLRHHLNNQLAWLGLIQQGASLAGIVLTGWARWKYIIKKAGSSDELAVAGMTIMPPCASSYPVDCPLCGAALRLSCLTDGLLTLTNSALPLLASLLPSSWSPIAFSLALSQSHPPTLAPRSTALCWPTPGSRPSTLPSPPPLPGKPGSTPGRLRRVSSTPCR